MTPRIGRYPITGRVMLAPMAGVTDRPFRQLVRRLGTGLTVGEMVSCDPRLRDTRKSRLRRDHAGEPEPRIVQIVGAAPARLAEAARYNAGLGADIIDINMGCPAKKVCGAAAGSALLSDTRLVGQILDAVVGAVDVPVTLKIRTGPEPDSRNATTIARIAEAAGIAALTIHGRTRACAFRGRAEHATTRAVRETVALPLIANGDIDSPARAAEVLAFTGADAVMIGRAAQGNPWLPGAVARALAGAPASRPASPLRATQPTVHIAAEDEGEPALQEVRDVLLAHLQALHAFYGAEQGVRIARKHLSWYCGGRPHFDAFWCGVRELSDADAQVRHVEQHFARLVDSRTDGEEEIGPERATARKRGSARAAARAGDETNEARAERARDTTSQPPTCLRPTTPPAAASPAAMNETPRSASMPSRPPASRLASACATR